MHEHHAGSGLLQEPGVALAAEQEYQQDGPPQSTCNNTRCNKHAQISWQSICCRISQSHVCSLQPEMQTSVCWMHGTSTPTKSLRVHKIQTTSSACMLGFSHTGARTDIPFSTLNAAMSANLVRIKQLNIQRIRMHMCTLRQPRHAMRR